MQQRVISVSNGVTRHPLYRMGKPVDFCLNAGEQLAVDYRKISSVDE